MRTKKVNSILLCCWRVWLSYYVPVMFLFFLYLIMNNYINSVRYRIKHFISVVINCLPVILYTFPISLRFPLSLPSLLLYPFPPYSLLSLPFQLLYPFPPYSLPIPSLPTPLFLPSLLPQFPLSPLSYPPPLPRFSAISPPHTYHFSPFLSPQDVLATLLNNLKVQERQMRVCTTVAIAIVAETCSPFTVLPALMNEYRVPELNVQNGVLKSLSFLFEYIGEMGKDYIYAVTPLLEDALMDR